MSIIQSNKKIADKYPAYKDSGEYWMGYIPEHWEVLNNEEVRNEEVSAKILALDKESDGLITEILNFK